MTNFDPNGVGIANGNIFGFPCTEEEATLVIIPVPWDATASYGKGTSKGPEAILNASTQLDFFHPKLNRAYDTKVFMSPISKEWEEINDTCCKMSIDYLALVESEGELSAQDKFKEELSYINKAHLALKDHLKERATKLLNQGKIVAVLGGEHSTPLGLLQALNEKYTDFGILQIDAHADLRDAYEGFEQSHASIMFNALKTCGNLSKIVQVGVRDVSENEFELSKSDPRIHTFYDWDLKEAHYLGKTWADQVKDIIKQLPKNIYISFDIDGLNPELCPNTGTPVAGGFELEALNFMLFSLIDAGKNIIGFDLNEVSPGEKGDWDANVGARVLWNLVCLTEKNRKEND